MNDFNDGNAAKTLDKQTPPLESVEARKHRQTTEYAAEIARNAGKKWSHTDALTDDHGVFGNQLTHAGLVELKQKLGELGCQVGRVLEGESLLVRKDNARN